MEALEETIINRLQNRFRVRYLYGRFFATVIYVFFSLNATYNVVPTYWLIDIVTNVLPSADFSVFVSTNVPMVRATAIGAIARVFSMSLGIRSLQFDVDTMSARSRKLFTDLLSISRTIIGIIVSLFISLAVKTDIVFQGLSLKSTDRSMHYGILYVLAFLSGFSEQFVPNVLKKVEAKNTPS